MLEMKVGKTKSNKSITTLKYLSQQNGLNIYLDAHGELETFYNKGITLDITNFNPFKDKVTYEEFKILHHGYLGENTVMLRKTKELLKEKLKDDYNNNPIQFMIRYHPKYARNVLPNNKLIKTVIDEYQVEKSDDKQLNDAKNRIIEKLKEVKKQEEKEIENSFNEHVKALYSINNLIDYIIDTEPLIDERFIEETIYRLGASWEPHETQYYEVFNNNEEVFHQTHWGSSSFGKHLLINQLTEELKKMDIKSHIKSFLNKEINKPIHVFIKTRKHIPIMQMRATYYWLIHQINILVNKWLDDEKNKKYIEDSVDECVVLPGGIKGEQNESKWFLDKYINYTVTYIANNFLRGNIKDVWPHWDLTNTSMFLNVYEFEKIPVFIQDKVDVWKIYEPKTNKEFNKMNRFFERNMNGVNMPSAKLLSQRTGFIAKKVQREENQKAS